MISILIAVAVEVCVVDADTHQPLPKGRVEYRVQFENGSHSGGLVFFTASGAYKLNLPAGTCELTASAPGHLRQSIRVKITPRNPQSIQFELERGIHVPLEIVTSDGSPRAKIFEETSGGVITESTADGTYLLAGRPGETHLLYVVPSDGSFARVRVVIPDRDRTDPLRIVVPPPAGDSRVKARGSRLNLLYNGKVIPPEVLRTVAPGVQSAGTGEFFLSRLPDGFYEVWTAEGCETFIPGFIGPETRVTFSVPRSAPE